MIGIRRYTWSSLLWKMTLKGKIEISILIKWIDPLCRAVTSIREAKAKIILRIKPVAIRKTKISIMITLKIEYYQRILLQRNFRQLSLWKRSQQIKYYQHSLKNLKPLIQLYKIVKLKTLKMKSLDISYNKSKLNWLKTVKNISVQSHWWSLKVRQNVREKW